MVGIAVVGGRDFVLGFRLAGVRETYIEENIESRVNTIISEKKLSILVVQDSDFKALPPGMRRKLSESVEPVVISVGRMETDDIRERIKKAIGIDLYKK